MRKHLQKRIPLIVLASLAAILFWKFFLLSQIPFPGNYLQAWYEPWRSLHFENGTITLSHKAVVEDVFRQILPFRLLAMEQISNFQLPLWNPYNGAGQPLLATINNGFLDPFNLLFYVLRDDIAWGVYTIVQFLLIVFATFFYTQKLGLAKSASLVAAITFGLSGFVTVRLIFGIYGLALATLPLALFFIEDFRDRPEKHRILFLPLIVFILFVSSQPQTSAYLLVFITFYIFLRLFRKNKHALKKTFFVLFLMFLGVGLSGMQLVPAYELSQYAHVKTEYSREVIDKFLLPVKQLITVPIPNFFGNQATYNYWGHGDYAQTVGYVGIFTTFLALLAVFTRKVKERTISLFYLVTAIIAAVLATYNPLTNVLYSLPIPLLSTGAPSRIFLLSTFALCILAGIGFQRIVRGMLQKRYFFLLAGLTSCAALYALGVTYNFYTSAIPCAEGLNETCRMIAFRNTALEVTSFLASLVFLSLAIFFKNKVKWWLLTLGVLIFTATAFYNAWKFMPFSYIPNLYPEHSLTAKLREATGYDRAFGISEGNIQSNIATKLHIYDPQYYHPLYILRYRELIEYGNTGQYNASLPRGDATINSYFGLNEEATYLRERLLDLTSTKYRLYKTQEIASASAGTVVLKDNTWTLFANEDAVPRAYLVDTVLAREKKEEILSMLFSDSFDIQKAAVIEEALPLEENQLTGGFATLTDYQPNRATVQTESQGPSVLVLTDNYYPGWQATIDGKPTKIYRANYAFRAVPVPAGKHLVTFSYNPISFRIGTAASLLSLVILLIVFVGTRLRDKVTRDKKER